MAEKEAKTIPKFKGSELIRAAAGTTKDILSVLLDPAALYTEQECAEKLSAFLKKEVK